MQLLDNWLVIPLLVALNTLGLTRKAQVVIGLLSGVVLVAAPAILDVDSPWWVVAATTANNVVVVILITLLFELLWRRLKWAAVSLGAVAAVFLALSHDGRILLALTVIGMYAVTERWRLLPPFRTAVRPTVARPGMAAPEGGPRPGGA